MVEDYGMSERLGPISLGLERGARLLLGEYSYGKEANYSEATAELVDQEVKELITGNYRRVKEALAENKRVLEGIAEVLLEKETLEGDAFRELVERFRSGGEETGGENAEQGMERGAGQAAVQP